MEQEKARQSLIDNPGHIEYLKWLELDVTKKVFEVLVEESRAPMVPSFMLENPHIGNAMFHQRVGVDWCLNIMKSIDVVPAMDDIEADYGANATTGE